MIGQVHAYRIYNSIWLDHFACKFCSSIKPKHIQGSTCFQSLALEGMWLQTLLEGTNDPTNVITVYSGKSPWQHIFFINGTRILTHWLYLRISCLLEEELDNVQGRSILKHSWLHSSMFWSPNIGNLLRFMI